MASLADVRAKYPEYNYLNDNELADAMHRKFYADMPREEFDRRVGLKPQAPQMTLAETAQDVAKSAGIGVVEGGIGLATLPGNLEALGRIGINAGAGLVGIKPPVSEETFLPTFDDWKGRVEEYTGEFYEPRSTLGKYANTAGQFASLAIGGPATAAARATRVLAPAVASETAGQLTEGTSLEPWARAAGALVGPQLPNAARRMVTPNPVPADRAQQLATLQNEGVTAITAGQRTGNKPLRWAESVTADTPLSGGRAAAIDVQQREQFTRAALRRAGVQADRATPQVIDDAFQAIGREYDQFAQGGAVVGSRAFDSRLDTIARNYERMTPDAQRVPLVRSVADELTARTTAPNGARVPIQGRDYASIRSALQRARRGLKSDWQASQAVQQLVDTLDQAMVRSLPRPQRAARLQQLRDMNRRYKNLLAVEDAAAGAGEMAAMGLITPAQLKAAIKRHDKKNYTRNRSDMAPLARAGEAILSPLPQSGTGPRAFWQTMFAAPTAAAGALMAGAPGMVAGALAPVTGQALGARAIMNPAVQRYLANQRIPQLPQQKPVSNTLLAIAAMQAAQQEE